MSKLRSAAMNSRYLMWMKARRDSNYSGNYSRWSAKLNLFMLLAKLEKQEW